MTPKKDPTFWKEVAIFLADCHAGTIESLPVRRLNADYHHRFLSIADTAAQALEGAFSDHRPCGNRRSTKEIESYRMEVAARLRKAIADAAKQERTLVRKIKAVPPDPR